MTIFILILIFVVILAVIKSSRSKQSNTSKAKTEPLFYDIPDLSEPITENEDGLKKKDFRVAGVQYYEHNISKLARKNLDWNKDPSELVEADRYRRVYEFNYVKKPVYLIPEPTNPHDKKAIMVQIAGQKVGYIYSEETGHVKGLLEKDVKYISAFIKGGKCRLICPNGEVRESEETLSISIRIAYV